MIIFRYNFAYKFERENLLIYSYIKIVSLNFNHTSNHNSPNYGETNLIT